MAYRELSRTHVQEVMRRWQLDERPGWYRGDLRQASANGRLVGLGVFVLLSLWFVLVTGFTFFEAFILPLLASDSPRFAESFLGIFTGSVGEVNVVVLATVWSHLGVAYILGDLLFSIAAFRAAILPRRAAALVGFGLPGRAQPRIQKVACTSQRSASLRQRRFVMTYDRARKPDPLR